MGDVSEDGAGRRARGLDRAFEVLEFLRRQRKPMRPNEIAQLLKMPRSTIYELIHLMVRHEIIEHRGDDGRVFLGRKLYYLGMSYAEEFDLMRESERLLDRLVEETRETAQMCMLDGDKYTVALMREGSRPFRISSDVGEPVPLPWTASGRLLLSHLNDDEIRAFIPADDFRLPNGQWLDVDDFIRQTRQAVLDGYFSFNSIVETFTHCFAIPVYGKDGVCVATLCLVAPREDGLKNHDFYVQCLQNAARDLSAALGGHDRMTGDRRN